MHLNEICITEHLKKIQKNTNNNGIKDWLKYYQQPYILSSLNQFISNINHKTWCKSGTNTNNAEKVAHFMVNREGKQLKLLSAILRGKKYNEQQLKLYITIQKLSLSTNKKSSKKSKEEPLENEKTEILELEIEEKKMVLREHAIKARIAEVKKTRS
ncbi:hypothetical protein RhiirA5_503282 [Rhizophagus irregularis]|uniref:Uncharacterized protein n=1 Tax=Rhizophagus irregularis TaxID=588596 RepID=A0A2I1EZP6_9GLOM|nr:hypothetical protein RhiirA5_503282 [Rhizophagus irregularis]PKY27599.1 hypothetical protein RhiirB3_529302 [Rhizophagus irregularis]